jgi:hypothetical protein
VILRVHAMIITPSAGLIKLIRHDQKADANFPPGSRSKNASGVISGVVSLADAYSCCQPNYLLLVLLIE